MARPKGSTYEPEAIAYAVAEVAKGRGTREVAEELAELGVEVSHMTIARWCKAPPPEVPATPAVSSALTDRLRARQAPPAEPPPEVPAEDPDAAFDFEASLQRMIREAEREAKAHDLASNPRGAQAAMRRASEMMKVLAQSEKRKPADPDVLTFSRTEIERGFADATDLLERLCARPVLCSACSRELSVKFGRGEG